MTRNVLCGKYRECLNLAVKSNQAWDCEGCEHENEITRLPFEELEGCHFLLWRLFRPDLYREFLEFENIKRLKGI